MSDYQKINVANLFGGLDYINYCVHCSTGLYDCDDTESKICYDCNIKFIEEEKDNNNTTNNLDLLLYNKFNDFVDTFKYQPNFECQIHVIKSKNTIKYLYCQFGNTNEKTYFKWNIHTNLFIKIDKYKECKEYRDKNIKENILNFILDYNQITFFLVEIFNELKKKQYIVEQSIEKEIYKKDDTKEISGSYEEINKVNNIELISLVNRMKKTPTITDFVIKQDIENVLNQLNKGANPNEIHFKYIDESIAGYDINIYTPILQLALKQNNINIELIQLLISYNANPYLVSRTYYDGEENINETKSAFDIIKNQHEIIKILQTYNGDINFGATEQTKPSDNTKISDINDNKLVKMIQTLNLKNNHSIVQLQTDFNPLLSNNEIYDDPLIPHFYSGLEDHYDNYESEDEENTNWYKKVDDAQNNSDRLRVGFPKNK